MDRILVGLDTSPRSAAVLSGALDLASWSGARMTLLRAVEMPVDVSPESYAVPLERAGSELLREAKADLEKMAGDLPSGVVAGVRTEFGVPWEVICRIAREESADLIVIGSHGYDIIDRMLGTTAAKVVNHAEQSVLVVRGALRSRG
jgi:nucleotide-binding universal stress UspA family protein